MRILLAVLITGLFCLTACDKNDAEPKTSPAEHKTAPVAITAKPAPPQPLATHLLLQQPLDAKLVETPNQALPIWRQHAKGQPALVLLSNVPYLQQIPEEVYEEARELLQFASDRELVKKTEALTSDPVLLPLMSLRAALQEGFFSRAIWLFPTRSSAESLSLEIFRGQLLESGMATQKEADRFLLEGGVFQGTIAGIPFLAASPEAIVRISEPVVLHIDLSYFQPLYKGEIKTPLYPLITQVLAGLKEQQWQIAAASICQANQPGGLPLETRFIGKDLSELLRNPSLLIEETPLQWARRAQALYLENFMRKEEIRQLLLEMEATAPKDPSVKYALYQSARQFKEANKALQYLREAVALDPVYANEYLALADLALEKKGPAKAIEMLELARSSQPENPFIPLSMARASLNAGHRELAVQLLSDLQKLSWSNVYYPGAPGEIQELLKLAQTQ